MEVLISNAIHADASVPGIADISSYIEKLKEDTVPGRDTIYHQLRNDGLAIEVEYGEMLMHEITLRKPSVIVEVGTGHGYSTAWLKLGTYMANKGTIHTFDTQLRNPRHDTNCPSFNKTMDYFGDFDNLKIPDSIDFIFHDSQHKIELIEKDMERLIPKLNKKSVIYVHDAKGHVGVQLRQYFEQKGFKYSQNNESYGMGCAEN